MTIGIFIEKKCDYIYLSLIKIKIIMLVNLHFSLKRYFFKSYKKCTFSACNLIIIIIIMTLFKEEAQLDKSNLP